MPPISMNCDSQIVLSKVSSKNVNDKRRHIRVRYKSIRNLITNGIIPFDFVRSKRNIANPSTKRLMHQQILDS